jgi:hypothetical protein
MLPIKDITQNQIDILIKKYGTELNILNNELVIIAKMHYVVTKITIKDDSIACDGAGYPIEKVEQYDLEKTLFNQPINNNTSSMFSQLWNKRYIMGSIGIAALVAWLLYIRIK